MANCDHCGWPDSEHETASAKKTHNTVCNDFRPILDRSTIPHPVNIQVCSVCGGLWDLHLKNTRERLKIEDPERFYVGNDGQEYPIYDSLVIRTSVTPEDCPPTVLNTNAIATVDNPQPQTTITISPMCIYCDNWVGTGAPHKSDCVMVNRR